MLKLPLLEKVSYVYEKSVASIGGSKLQFNVALLHGSNSKEYIEAEACYKDVGREKYSI